MCEDPHEYKFIEIAFGWRPGHIWLHTTLEGHWPHYMILEVYWDGRCLLGSHNFVVTALGSCAKWPLEASFCAFEYAKIDLKQSIYNEQHGGGREAVAPPFPVIPEKAGKVMCHHMYRCKRLGQHGPILMCVQWIKLLKFCTFKLFDKTWESLGILFTWRDKHAITYLKLMLLLLRGSLWMANYWLYEACRFTQGWWLP